MITQGQKIFAILFILVFIALMIYSYAKDAQNHKKYYQKAGIKTLFWSVLVVVIFLLFRYHEAVRGFFF